jgi:short subunit dehydrogenase-like uncharacterized protein
MVAVNPGTMIDVLLLGAGGSSGHHVAREIAARGLSLRLAGRRLEPLAALAEELAGTGVPVECVPLDVTDAAALRAAVGQVRVVVSTVGPFARYAPPVLDACLDIGVCYVDIANELTAIRGVLARDERAKELGVTVVTGAGFGPAGTESLVLGLVEELGEAPDLVRVATAPASSHVSQGVRDTIAALLPEGATTYVDGVLVREPFGTGATALTFGGTRRSMLPGPAGDLEVAQAASGARNVSAFFADPSQRVEGDAFSYAYAEVVATSGRRLAAQARVRDAVAAGAAFTAEVARRVLAGALAGAWTPGQLFGGDLFPQVTGVTVTSLTDERV